MNIENVQLLKALLDVKRQQVLLTKRTDETSSLIEDSYAFAMDRRLCPVFHTDDTDPFDPVYSISRSFINDVLNYCDEKWHAKELLTFYDLEAHFGHGYRCELIDTLRYAVLAKRFGEEFYKGLATNCPVEAHGINEPFRKSQISLV